MTANMNAEELLSIYSAADLRPFGWRKVPNTDPTELEMDPAEQAALQRIAALSATEAPTLRALARQLEEEGHPPRSGGSWHPYALARIIDMLEGGRPCAFS